MVEGGGLCICPDSGLRVFPLLPILSGPRLWPVLGFDHFLSGLAPGRFAKFQKICPDRDQTVSAINWGPVKRFSDNLRASC